MTQTPEPTPSQEGKTCSTGSCGMKICSPCVLMKVVLLGYIIYAGIQYFVKS